MNEKYGMHHFEFLFLRTWQKWIEMLYVSVLSHPTMSYDAVPSPSVWTPLDHPVIALSCCLQIMAGVVFRDI